MTTSKITVQYQPSVHYARLFWFKHKHLTGIAEWDEVHIVDNNTLCGFYGKQLVHTDSCMCGDYE